MKLLNTIDMTTATEMTTMKFELGQTLSFEVKTKATMVIVNGAGFPVFRNIWLNSIEVVRGVNGYGKRLIVRYTIKGKRKRIASSIDEGTIAIGWQEISGAINSSATSGMFMSFENGALDKMHNQLKNIIISTQE